MADYNQSAGPKEGKSAISAATRKQVFGGGSTGSAYPQPNYGGDEDALIKMLMELVNRWRPQETFSEKAAGLQSAKDPVGWAIKQGEAANIARNADPWGVGGAFEGRRAADLMTPQQILASQGNTAANQWAQLGAGGDAQRQANMLRGMFGSGSAYYGM